MTDLEDRNTLGKIFYDEKNQARKSWSYLDKPVPDRWLCFCPGFLSFCWSSLVVFGEFTFQKLQTNQQFWLGWIFLKCGRIHFIFTKLTNMLISRKNRVFISLSGPSETGKSEFIYNWLRIGTFQPKFDKIYFFYQHSQPLYDVMQKEIENLEFVQGKKFEFIDSSKNNSTKYLLLFDDSCEEICYSKAFVELRALGDIGVWAQSTLNTTFFTRAS